jgi:hypothetical protein
MPATKAVRAREVALRHCPNRDCGGLARDGVVAEFVDTVAHCLDCGTSLASGERADPRLPEVEYHELSTVFVAADLTQGYLVSAAIESEGIPVFVKGEFLQGAVGELPANVSQVEVQVPVERVDEARLVALQWEGPFSSFDESSVEVAGVEALVAETLLDPEETSE